MMGFLSHYFDDDENPMQETIEIPKVSTPILGKVVDYCNHSIQEPMNEIKIPLRKDKLSEIVQTWYSEFCNVEKDVLFDLVAAANYMDISPLLDLTTLAVAFHIKGQTGEQLCDTFGVNVEEYKAMKAAEEEANNNADNANAEAPAAEN
jgi:S-phase kinase-associated protein 1